MSRSEVHAGMMAARRTIREVGVPTLLRSGPYRFFFHSQEHDPPHVHVEFADGSAVFNLTTAGSKRAKGYTRRHLARIEEIVTKHEAEFLRRWYEYFDG